MVERVNAVAPGVRPVVFGEMLFQPICARRTVLRKSLLVMQQRILAVRDCAVIFKMQQLRLNGVCHCLFVKHSKRRQPKHRQKLLSFHNVNCFVFLRYWLIYNRSIKFTSMCFSSKLLIVSPKCTMCGVIRWFSKWLRLSQCS